MCSSAWEINDTTVKTHSLSSSNVFTEYRGEVGSRCWTSTWFLFRTRERRISLFKRDCSARSTLSPSFNQPTSSVPMLPEQVERKKQKQKHQIPPNKSRTNVKLVVQLGSEMLISEKQLILTINLPFMSPLTWPRTRSTFFEKLNWAEKIQFMTLLVKK